MRPIGIIEATTETARYAAKDRRVLALISVKFGFGVAAGVLTLIAIFAKEVYRGGDIAFGLLMAARGVGALIGPFLGHRLSGRNHERLLPAIALAWRCSASATCAWASRRRCGSRCSR
jgi:predicted MFS family arabinose efflux permease